MAESTSSKRLTLRAVLRDVNPMVIRILEISDQLRLAEFHDIFRSILGWNGDLGYIIRIHGQEFNSFRGTRDRKPYTSSSFTAKRSSYTSATRCTCGSGMFAF